MYAVIGPGGGNSTGASKKGSVVGRIEKARSGSVGVPVRMQLPWLAAVGRAATRYHVAPVVIAKFVRQRLKAMVS